MRHELHFAENMHFIWEAVKLFRNTFCVVHTHILKSEDYYTHLLSLHNDYITHRIVTHLNVWAAVHTSQIYENKTRALRV